MSRYNARVVVGIGLWLRLNPSQIAFTTIFAVLICFPILSLGQVDSYPHNAVTCERCHNIPSTFGGSSMAVERIGTSSAAGIVPAKEGGIHHRHGESAQNSASPSNQISGERVSLNLMGDGYIESTAARSNEMPRNNARPTLGSRALLRRIRSSKQPVRNPTCRSAASAGRVSTAA
jgi:hypothetical protein